jgi:hypothetical protein
MPKLTSKAGRGKGKKPLTTEQYHRLTGKLSLADARGRLARIQTDIEAVADYLNGACCEKEEDELYDCLEPVENIDFMLEQLQ